MTKKQILFSAACLMAASSAMAQGNGMAGITEATNMVTSYFDPATKLIYAIGAVGLDWWSQGVWQVLFGRSIPPKLPLRGSVRVFS